MLGVICKLDVEKVYDNVNWNFLMYLLKWCGFSKKWRRWIMWCISTIKFSILINGTPIDFFGSTMGVCQGNSLSPLLFDVVMEVLSCLLDATTMLEQFSGFSVGNLAGTLLTVSHLLFADETLNFCDVDSHHLAALRGILTRFEVVSGLKINLLKLELVPIGNVPNIWAFHWMLLIKRRQLGTLFWRRWSIV